MKKILHIQVLPKLSGVQRVSLGIMRGLPDTRYEKWVMFAAPDPAVTPPREVADLVGAFAAAGTRVVFSPNLRRDICWRDVKAVVEIWRLCRRERFDIVHAHSTKPGIVGRLAAWAARTPLVVHTVHGLAFHDYVKFPRWQFYWACEMFASCFCHRIVMVNRFYGRYFGWFRRKVSTIYNGLPSGKTAAPEKSPKSASAPIEILFVGRLDEPKDPLTLLRAAAIVCRDRPRARFTLVGDGELRGDCELFIADNRLADAVNLAGWQSDTSPFYASADIFAASSIYESFGLMFVEAGHYRLPIVATAVEGVPEVVTDGGSGILCPPRDPASLAAAIIRLIDDPALRTHLALGSFTRSGEFTEARMVDQYRAIYEA